MSLASPEVRSTHPFFSTPSNTSVDKCFPMPSLATASFSSPFSLPVAGASLPAAVALPLPAVWLARKARCPQNRHGSVSAVPAKVSLQPRPFAALPYPSAGRRGRTSQSQQALPPSAYCSIPPQCGGGSLGQKKPQQTVAVCCGFGRPAALSAWGLVARTTA